MKRVIVFGIVAVMVMGLAVTASAAVDDTWMMQLRALNSAGASAGTITLGTKVGAIDAYTTTAGEDATLPVLVGTPAEISSLISPRASKDVRSPILANDSSTWDLTLFNNGGTGTITLTGWMATLTNQLNPSTAGDQNLKIELFQGSTLLWTVPQLTSGTAAAPTFTRNFDFVAGSPISLQLVATTVVPEPGSMVALLSGLVGLVGFGIRRRK